MVDKKRLVRMLAELTLMAGCTVPVAGMAAQGGYPLEEDVRARAGKIESKLIEWRHDIHQHPELGDQETRTAQLVASHLRSLGLEVRTGVARTGVVGVLHGGKPGPVVALRADMDALPVKESVDLPFASKAKGTYLGKEVDVMHACGHDTHTAILMAVAEVLAGMKDQLPGTVKFVFQPAEEGPSQFVPDGTNSWGAKLMVQEGVMQNPRPEAVFGLHVMSGSPSGQIGYRAGPALASSDDLRIKITGRQTHGGLPWAGIDPITTGAQVIMGLQTVISRRTNISSVPSVVSIGTFNSGVRYNIIPDTAEMTGTIRSYDPQVRADVHKHVKQAVEHIAEGAGAKAEVKIIEKYDPTINDEKLTERMLPTLTRAADGNIRKAALSGGAEDFSFYAKEVPGLFIFLGVTPKDQDMKTAAPNHSPKFMVDESALIVGVRALANLTVDYLASNQR